MYYIYVTITISIRIIAICCVYMYRSVVCSCLSPTKSRHNNLIPAKSSQQCKIQPTETVTYSEALQPVKKKKKEKATVSSVVRLTDSELSKQLQNLMNLM